MAAALATWRTTGARVRRRVRQFSQRPTRPLPFRPRPLSPAARSWLFAGGAGLATAVVLGGLWGPLLGVAAAVVVERVLRRSGASPVDDDDLLVALPLACDLLAV